MIEKQKIREVERRWLNPKWTMDEVQHQMKSKQHKKKKSNKQNDNPSGGMVVIPCVEVLQKKSRGFAGNTGFQQR